MSRESRSTTLGAGAAPTDDARERIVRTAYDLFSLHGVQAIGVDRVIAEAGVAKTTLYRHFRSKDDLIVAVLERREERWTRGWLEPEAARRAKTPENRLLATFDAFADWFRRDDYEGCLFANTLLEGHDRTRAVGVASIKGLAGVRAFVSGLAAEAGVRDPDGFARKWQLLLLGSIVAASGDDRDAAAHGRAMGVLLLERERVRGHGPAHS
jgi:AcrR family transcriptional regulator